MRSVRRIVSAATVVALVAVMVGVVVHRRAQARAAEPYGVGPLSVHVAPVTQQALEAAHSYLGVIEAWQTATIASRLAARVDAVPQDEGDSVKAGDLLLALDDNDIQAQVRALDSTIESLGLSRQFWVSESRADGQLAQDGVIPTVEAEATHIRRAEAVAKLEASQRTRDGLLAKLVYTRLVSPFAGMISTRSVDPGDLAAPGQPLMVVEDRSSLKVGFDAPQGDMEFMRTGLPVRAEVGGQMLALSVTHIHPSLDRSRMVRVEVRIPADPSFQTGAFVSLAVIWSRNDQAITVPLESLMQRADDGWAVFVVADGKLQLRSVQLGMTGAGRVEVTGVQPGEEVVTSTFLGWANLSDGLSVEVYQ
jgi:RND family efflux transporter MFP subunit